MGEVGWGVEGEFKLVGMVKVVGMGESRVD